MRKIIIGLMVCLSLGACVNAGDFDLLPARKKFFSIYRGYAVDFYDNDESLINEDFVHENDYELNKAFTVKKGENVLSNTVKNKKSFQRLFAKFNKKGALNNNIYPMRIYPDKEYNIMGWTTIDNEEYTIIESDLDDHVFLFNENGEAYKNGGKIIDERLHLLDDTVFSYPSDLKMRIVNKMRDEVSSVKNGYQVKYGGVKLDRLFFDYLGFDSDSDTSGEFKQINFPNKPGLIVINGIGLRVLKADDASITYMILKDDL